MNNSNERENIESYYYLELPYIKNKEKTLKIAIRKVFKPKGTFQSKIKQYEEKYNEYKYLLESNKQLSLFDF